MSEEHHLNSANSGLNLKEPPSVECQINHPNDQHPVMLNNRPQDRNPQMVAHYPPDLFGQAPYHQHVPPHFSHSYGQSYSHGHSQGHSHGHSNSAAPSHGSDNGHSVGYVGQGSIPPHQHQVHTNQVPANPDVGQGSIPPHQHQVHLFHHNSTPMNGEHHHTNQVPANLAARVAKSNIPMAHMPHHMPHQNEECEPTSVSAYLYL